MTTSHRLGELGEDLARLFLQMCGYRFLDRRFRLPGGEIDLVMAAGQTVVFVEVKTRSSNSPAAPQEFITHRQKLRLRRAARTWLASHPADSRYCRFDVVAVVFGGEDRGLSVRHFKGGG